MVYNLSGIIIGRSKSCNRSNVVAKSVKLICTHVKDLANLTVMHIRRLVLLGCGLRGTRYRHLTFPLPSLASFPSWRKHFALSCFTSCSSLPPISSTCLFWEFSCVKSGASLFYPVAKLLTQNFCSCFEYLKR
jgi:hypothetical protein